MQDLVGLALPFIADFVNKKIPYSNIRFLLSILLSIGAALLLNVDKLRGGDWNELLGKVGLIFTESQIVYRLYWKNSHARFKVFGRMQSF